MDQMHLEEKRLAMAAIKAQNERHLQALQETWEKEREALQAKVMQLDHYAHPLQVVRCTDYRYESRAGPLSRLARKRQLFICGYRNHQN
jgi:hypothetical protein